MNAALEKTVTLCFKCSASMQLGVKHDSSGRPMYKWFCSNCLWRPAQWLPHAEVKTLITSGLAANDLPEATYESRQWEEKRGERDAEFQAKRAAYHEYLQSHEWAVKRNLVLERDNHMCQACLSAKAQQVHHTSYFGIVSSIGQFHEPLFNLVSVCRPCHVRIHGGEISEDEAT